MRGVRLSDGRTLKLRAVRRPGGWMSTDAWVDEFIAALTADRTGEPAEPPAIRTPTARRRDIERAEQELAAAGF